MQPYIHGNYLKPLISNLQIPCNIMTFLFLIIVPMLIGFLGTDEGEKRLRQVQWVASQNRITGREAAEAVMQSAGIQDVEIVECHGTLTTIMIQSTSDSH